MHSLALHTSCRGRERARRRVDRIHEFYRLRAVSQRCGPRLPPLQPRDSVLHRHLVQLDEVGRVGDRLQKMRSGREAGRLQLCASSTTYRKLIGSTRVIFIEFFLQDLGFGTLPGFPPRKLRVGDRKGAACFGVDQTGVHLDSRRQPSVTEPDAIASTP